MSEAHDYRPGESRLDRMERLMAGLAEHHAWFDEEYKRLLDALARLKERMDRMRSPEDPA